MENQTAQNASGAPLSVKKSPIKITNRDYKVSRVDWVIPTQHEEVDSDPGTPDNGAFIFKK